MYVLLAFLAVASFNVIMCLSVCIIYICGPFNGNIFIYGIRFFGATIRSTNNVHDCESVNIDIPINGQK